MDWKQHIKMGIAYDYNDEQAWSQSKSKDLGTELVLQKSVSGHKLTHNSQRLINECLSN